VRSREHPVLKIKDAVGIPWRTALALQEDGWHLLNAIVWAKPAHLPNPVKDRLVASHEMIFLLGKSERDVPLEFGDVWWIATVPYPGGHFAVFPPTLPERCIRASLTQRGTVLDPFSGSGTTGDVAMHLGHDYIGTDLNVKYLPLAEGRLRGIPFATGTDAESDILDLFSEEP
jgi:DNA modification methylase